MSQQADPKRIGLFVIGAITLLLAGLITFGSGKFFTPKDTFVMYFEGSLAGLQVGAPVTFRGVQIGNVSEILVRLNNENQQIKVPVYIEIQPNKIVEIGRKKIGDSKKLMTALIERGLRAQLELQSMVTGLLTVELDFHPNKPIRLTKDNGKVFQIPTVSSSIEELNQTLVDARDTLKAIKKFLDSKLLDETLTTMNSTLKSSDKVFIELGNELNPTMVYVQNAAKEFGQASRSIRVLTDYLSRHPEAILQGKSK